MNRARTHISFYAILFLSTTYILSTILLSRLTPYSEEILWNISADFNTTRQLTTDHIFCICHHITYLRKNGNTMKWCISYFCDFKKVYDSLRMDDLYNSLIKFGISMEMVRLIKMCLNETYSRVWVGKYLPDIFPIKNGLKQGDALLPVLFKFASEYALGWFRQTRRA